MDDLGKTTLYTRTTSEQLELYVAFIKNNPVMLANKGKTTSAERIRSLWEELAHGLNALKGPTRTPKKWKETMTHWRNQMRCRARKAKMRNASMTKSPAYTDETSYFDQLALKMFAVEVAPALGREVQEIVGANDSCSSSKDVSELQNPAHTTNYEQEEIVIKVELESDHEPAFEERPPVIEAVPEERRRTFKRKSNITNANNSVRKLIKLMEVRETREDKERKQQQQAQQILGDSMKSIGEGVKAMGEGMKAMAEGMKAMGEGMKAMANGLKSFNEAFLILKVEQSTSEEN